MGRGACTRVLIIARSGGVALLVPLVMRKRAARLYSCSWPHERLEKEGEEERQEGSFICRASVNGPNVKLSNDNAERGPAREWAPAIWTSPSRRVAVGPRARAHPDLIMTTDYPWEDHCKVRSSSSCPLFGKSGHQACRPRTFTAFLLLDRAAARNRDFCSSSPTP